MCIVEDINSFFVVLNNFWEDLPQKTSGGILALASIRDFL